MEKATFEDFYEVPNLNFDISRLRSDLDKILKNKSSIHQELHILVQYQ